MALCSSKPTSRVAANSRNFFCDSYISSPSHTRLPHRAYSLFSMRFMRISVGTVMKTARSNADRNSSPQLEMSLDTTNEPYFFISESSISFHSFCCRMSVLFYSYCRQESKIRRRSFIDTVFIEQAEGAHFRILQYPNLFDPILSIIPLFFNESSNL